MKKMTLDALALDKSTVARLSKQQLRMVVGGAINKMCGSGSSAGPPTITTNGGSTGCGSGSSTCFAG